MSELRNKKIIIVGAGISGLTAASRLLKKGYKNVSIFEATDTIGGRINTKYFGNGWVEIGAQWIHGEKDNIAYDTAVQNGLLSEPVIDGIESSTYVTEKGKKIDEKLVDEVYEFLEGSLDRANLTSVVSRDRSLNIEDYLNQKFQQLLRTKHAKITPEDEFSMRQIFNYFKAIQCSIEGCDSLSEQSPASFVQYKICEGNSLTNFKNGYHSLLKTVAANIPPSSIHVNKPVAQVDMQSVKTGVKIICVDSTEYLADHVILTVSLGFLKHNAHSFFSPPLPSAKLQTIERLGFGTVDKIFLEFSQPFWLPSSGGFSFLWDNQKITEDDKLSWSQGLIGFYTVPFATNVISGWITGIHARRMEAASDDQVVKECLTILKTFSGASEIPTVKSFIRSRWFSNPYTKGSYSYMTLEQIVNYELAKPLYRESQRDDIPTILFAGEATHPQFFSTVHGAMETGYREAERIIKYYSNLQGNFSHSNL